MDASIYCFTVFPYGAVEIVDPNTGAKFKVNGSQLKQFLELPSSEYVECLILQEPVCDE